MTEGEEEEEIDVNRILVAFTPLLFKALGRFCMLASLRFLVGSRNGVEWQWLFIRDRNKKRSQLEKV
jgi:hypothetical protein